MLEVCTGFVILLLFACAFHVSEIRVYSAVLVRLHTCCMFVPLYVECNIYICPFVDVSVCVSGLCLDTSTLSSI